MYSNFSKCSNTPTCSLSNNKFSKKFRRKRRKNKHKNSAAKKKYHQKQSVLSNSLHISETYRLKNSELSTSQQNYGNKISMSDWYWSNYKKAFEWQGKHSLAYWKSCALALQEENRYLLQVIKSFQPDMALRAPVRGEHSRVFVPERTSRNTNFDMPSNVQNTDERTENSENEDFEFEMSEEMIQYFEQSFKHKMNLEKEKRENELQEMDKKVKQMQENKVKRIFEMKLLYGEEASKIIGMETAVQLSYDKYCDSKSPKYWPNIPLRL